MLSDGDALVTSVNAPKVGQVEGVERGAVAVYEHARTGGQKSARTGGLDTGFRSSFIDSRIRTLQAETACDLFAELVAAETEYLGDWNVADAEVLAKSDAFRRDVTATVHGPGMTAL